MTYYYILYAILIVMAFIRFRYCSASSNRTLLTSKSFPVNWICFTCVLLLLMFRSSEMGIDLHGTFGYLSFFKYAHKTDLNTLMTSSKRMAVAFEKGFRLYVKTLSSIWYNFQFFLAVTAFISLLPIAVLINKKSCNPIFSWIIYLSTIPFLLLYSGLRQGITIGIGVIMYLLAEEKKAIPFLLLCGLAISIHASSVLLLLIYPLVNIKVGIKFRIAAIVLLCPVVLLKDYIIRLCVKLFPQYAYVFPAEGEGAYRYFAVLLIIYIVCCIFSDNSDFQNSYMNLFFIACAIQMLGLFSPNVTRAGYYFVISLCPLLPDVIENMKNRKIAMLLEAGSAACFVLFGLYCIYTTEWAMAYPYYWFWEQTV